MFDYGFIVPEVVYISVIRLTTSKGDFIYNPFISFEYNEEMQSFSTDRMYTEMSKCIIETVNGINYLYNDIEPAVSVYDNESGEYVGTYDIYKFIGSPESSKTVYVTTSKSVH